jgi:diguanylate cyclase (GGDEF)-like protein/PAS domain S-box-containing protein
MGNPTPSPENFKLSQQQFINEEPLHLQRYAWALVIVWTIIMILSLQWNIYLENQEVIESAKIEARAYMDKNLLYRRWNTGHGRVYVPVTPENPSNPYLAGYPERDIKTPSGQVLTLLNPAYMGRQIEEAGQEHQIREHTTSLKPVNPRNAPDPWEKTALEAMADGALEVSALEDLGGKPFFRFMRPIHLEKNCLSCHIYHGYKEGDLRGGLSISVPLEPYRAISRQHLQAIYWGHGSLWILGLIGIGWGASHLKHSINAYQKSQSALQESEENYREIYDKANDAILIHDMESGDIIDVNLTFCEITGLSRPEARRLKVADFSANEPSYTQKEALERIKLAAAGEPQLFEWLIKDKQGKLIWVEVNLKKAILRGKERILAVVHQISDRKMAEQDLQKANKKLKVLVHEYAQRNREINMLNSMSDLLQSCLTEEEAFAVINEFLPQLFSRDPGSLYILNPAKNLADPVSSWGASAPSEVVFEPQQCWSLRRGKVQIFPNSGFCSLCKKILRSPEKGSMCVPMLAHGEALGVLHLQSGSDELARLQSEVLEGFTEGRHRLAATVADHIGLALANLKLRQNLQDQAIRDPLTGLFNRRYMEETLPREIHRLQRQEGSLSVIMMDIDHFKNVNDTLGHEAGDAVLVALSNYLIQHVRLEDVPCRYGGEEFLLILPGASLEMGRQRAEQLRAGVEALQVEHNAHFIGPVTISIGVASWEQGDNGDSLIDAADKALYQAKAKGRNRVEVAAPSASKS